MGSLFAWLLFFFIFILIALLAIVMYQLMCLADLKFDYINPYDSASRINKMVLPEYFTQGILCLLYLITGHWFMSLLSAPYLYYNVRLYNQRKHLIDVTEIFNLVNWEKKQRLFKLGYLIFLLFISLFWMTWSALEEEKRETQRERESMGSLFEWLLFFFILIALLAIVFYQLMCLADLAFDYINPYDYASRINKMVLPEYFTQGVLYLLYLITGHWFMSLLIAPYLYYNVRLYNQRRHLVDVTEIFNLLNRERMQRLFKLGYLIFLLFISLFWMIWSALEEDERDF